MSQGRIPAHDRDATDAITVGKKTLAHRMDQKLDARSANRQTAMALPSIPKLTGPLPALDRSQMRRALVL